MFILNQATSKKSFPGIVILILLSCSILPTSVNAAANSHPDAELRKLLLTAIQGSDSFEDRFDAEVWLIDMSTRLKNTIREPEKRINLLKNVHHEATRAELSPELVLSIIQVESNFDRFAISTAGAIGLMQIMPFWLKEIGRNGDNLFNLQTNLRFGCTILKYYLNKEQGNITNALSRYNGSYKSFRYPKKVFKAWDNRWRL